MPAHPPWPYQLLDIGRLKADGWRPTAFREFVLKVHQRCNLACDYCYVYELADQSWRDRPAVMAPAIWRTAARRIRDHVRTHGLREIGIVLHGGEPLLAGIRRLTDLIEGIRTELDGSGVVRFGMQTNGVLLDEPVLRTLHGLGVEIGVSVDGSADSHDRHRRHRNGSGSHAAVHAALELLGDARYRSSFAGLLCTVDPSTDPVATYESLLAYEPPAIDFLLPHANWSTPPALGPTAYGDWLVAVFDRWYARPHKETSVRLFDETLSLLLGGASRSEQVGLSPAGVVVIESDGAIEQVDSLKSAYAGACATGMNVSSHSFDQALWHPGVVARQLGPAALSDTCAECDLLKTCGGGHYAHRYRAGEGFRNPSVYCADLMRFIGHVRGRVTSDLAVPRP